MLHLVVLVITSYLLGAIPFGFLAGKLKGIDLRKEGSGNIGATNAGRVLGKRWGYAVFLLDFAKGALGAFLGTLAAKGEFPAGFPTVACAAGALLGHLFPVYLGFKGGKGVATGAGIMASLVPGPFACSLLAWLLVVLATRMISAGSIVAALVLGCWAALQLLAEWADPVAAMVLLAGLLVIARHLGNLRRIMEGNENMLKDGLVFQVLPARLALATGSAWLGMALFFTFVTGLGTFGAFESLSLEEPRPYWLPLPGDLAREPEKGLHLPEPLRKEQGSLLAGVSVSAQFPWYFRVQAVLGAVLLGAVTARRPGSLGWIASAGLAWALAFAGWAMERKVEALRAPRNEATARYVQAAEPMRASLAGEVKATRAAFRQAHGISLFLNMATMACVAAVTAGGLFRRPD